jgi:hypothetical protein
MHPPRCPRDHLHNERQFISDLREAIGNVKRCHDKKTIFEPKICFMFDSDLASNASVYTPYPNAPTSWVMAVAISRTKPNSRRIGAKISSCSRA